MASAPCTPTTLYSTAYLTTTTEVLSASSTLSKYTIHSNSQSVHTVCANPPGNPPGNALGKESRECISPSIQTDIVDVFGMETMITLQVTRIEMLTETFVQGVKTVPCGRGLETGKASVVAAGSIARGASATPFAQPGASSSAVSGSSSQEQAQPAETQAWSSPSASSAIVTAVSAEASSAGSEHMASSSSEIKDGQQDADSTALATLTTTRYFAPSPSSSIVPSDAETATSGSSKGEVVGIVFGVLVGLLLFGVAVAGLVHWWRKRDKDGGEEIDEDEILGWRKVSVSKDEGYGDELPGRSQRFSTTASIFSTVSRLAHLARKPYASPLLRFAPAYGNTTSRAQRSSRGTIDGQTVRSNRLSQADLGSLVLHEHAPPMPFNTDTPVPPLPPSHPMPFKASSQPHSPDGTMSSFGGDVEALDEKSPTVHHRLTPWNPPLPIDASPIPSPAVRREQS